MVPNNISPVSRLVWKNYSFVLNCVDLKQTFASALAENLTNSAPPTFKISTCILWKAVLDKRMMITQTVLQYCTLTKFLRTSQISPVYVRTYPLHLKTSASFEQQVSLKCHSISLSQLRVFTPSHISCHTTTLLITGTVLTYLLNDDKWELY